MRIEFLIFPVLVGLVVGLATWKTGVMRRFWFMRLLPWAVVATSTSHTLLTTPPDSTRFRWSLFLLIACATSALIVATYRAERMRRE
jgi:hypothetical protein